MQSTTEVTTKFEVGQTYVMRWVTDSTLRSLYTVLARTAKTVTIESADGKVSQHRVTVFEGTERVMPFGRYSMAPVLNAERVLGSAAS